MKLLFNNTDFCVVIGANPFDNINDVANCVLDYIVHLDMSILKKSLERVNATVEVTNDTDDISISDDDEANSDVHITKVFTLKTLGNGKLDTGDNDKLHEQWLTAFDSVLRGSTIDYWRAKINTSTSDNTTSNAYE